MTKRLRPEVESCPCPVCRSDMAYVSICQSPIIIIPTMVVNDTNESPFKVEGRSNERL